MLESTVLNFIRRDRIFDLTPAVLIEETMTKNDVIAILNHFDAYWSYEEIPCKEKPHALLKSGKHSNGFIALKKVLNHPRMNTLFADVMAEKICEKINAEEIDVIVSSAYSAISLGLEVTNILSRFNRKIEYLIAEKDEKGNPTIIRDGIDASKKVLIINELMTTSSGSTWETKKAVLECNGKGNSAPQIFDLSFVFIHRSKDYKLPDGTEVIPIFHFNMEDWEAHKCPYCEAGSEAIKPKQGENWKLYFKKK